jgi:AcrR family transcriptional regulator
MANEPAQAPAKALRADARRNRARVLQVAAEVFAAEGLAVPVHEIARRAGVGTGTVSRHFPTKEELFAAVLLDRMAVLSAQADALAESEDATTAFFTFFARLVHEGAAHRGLAETLVGAGYDIDRAAAERDCDVSARMNAMLLRAQRAGGVREDVTYPDVKALMTGCLSREPDPAGADAGADALSRLITVVSDGLRARANPAPRGQLPS